MLNLKAMRLYFSYGSIVVAADVAGIFVVVITGVGSGKVVVIVGTEAVMGVVGACGIFGLSGCDVVAHPPRSNRLFMVNQIKVIADDERLALGNTTKCKMVSITIFILDINWLS